MRILRWLAVSFSLYSRIPMPVFDWNEEDLRHSLIFFPAVGAVIGVLTVVVNSFPAVAEWPLSTRSILTLLIPVILTGGFHLDGYMDTTDALRSYRSKEEKLRILKDPHVGAFAVTGLAVFFLIMCASLSLILAYGDGTMLILLACVYPLSRIISALLAICLRKARRDGMLTAETDRAGAGMKLALWIQLALCVGIMVYVNLAATMAVMCGFVFFSIHYKCMTERAFGGVTGDTAGYFVTKSEMIACILLALLSYLK